jgi:WD40 repeat protein
VREFNAKEIANHVGDLAPFGGIVNIAFSPDKKRLTVTGLHKCSNALAGNRRAVAMSFDWVTGEKQPKQECLKKELDATMWRALYHPGGTMIGIVAKEIGFWNSGTEDAFHLFETPSEIFDCDFHPNGIDLFTAHFDGHVRCLRCSAG